MSTSEVIRLADALVSISEDENSKYYEQPPYMFMFAQGIARHMPRGKGWFPRWIGRTFCKSMKAIVRTASGASLAVDPSHLDIYTSIILKKGMWDKHVLDACITVLRPGSVFYDIGASAGYMSIEVAKFFNDTVDVLAFEPQPTLAYASTVSAALNRFCRLKVYSIMIGKEEGKMKLHIPSHSIHASAIPREGKTKHIICPITTIDRQIKENQILPPNVMKIDVEGGEMNVFLGAERTIRENSPCIIFESDDNMKRWGYGRKDLINYLCGLTEYEFFLVGKNGLQHLTQDNFNDMSVSDILAVPPGRENQLGQKSFG